jgi:hypothetical protein
MGYQKKRCPVKLKTKLTGHLIFFTLLLSRWFGAAFAERLDMMQDVQRVISQISCYISLMITSTKMTMTKTTMANPKISPPAGR